MKASGSMVVLGLVAAMCSTGCRQERAQDAASAQGHFSDIKPGEIRRTLVASRPATGLPGWETRLYLIEYGPGASAPVHIHPVVGVGEVVEGDFVSAFGDEQPVEVHAGQGFVDPPATPHRMFRNASSERPLRFLVAYTIRPEQSSFYPGSVMPAP